MNLLVAELLITSSTKENRTSLVTITQTSQAPKQTPQSAAQLPPQGNQPQISSNTSSSVTKLSPIKMVQPLGFPTKLPPPPPQYQTSSTSSSSLLKSSVASNKESKPSPPIR